ncbi:Chitin synthase, class 2 [Mortierella sp. AD094]|nr:Chitin synthase, class 2 [Mortierella sp. AD094]
MRRDMKTIAHLCDSRLVVCANKRHPRVFRVRAAMGAYQEGIAKETIAGKPVTVYIYEYTTQAVILFCLKEENKKKLNSHRWLFNAFAPRLNLNVCILIDDGIKPSGTSIHHLWKAFDRDSSVGGACGEIYADLDSNCSNLLNSLVA